jgi:hypothetical protein
MSSRDPAKAKPRRQQVKIFIFDPRSRSGIYL